MSRNIEVHFHLNDHLNPGFGYQLKIRDAETGESLLSTNCHPGTGRDLLTASDCLEVITMYTPNDQ